MNIPMNRKHIFLAGGLLVLACTVLFFAFKDGRPPGEVPTAAAAVRPFEVTIHAVGQLDAVNAVTIGSGLKGEVKIVHLVEEGARVKTGDVLVRFDSRAFEEKAASLEASVEEWETVVNAHKQLFQWEENQAGREIKAAEFDVQVAQLERQKLQQGDGPLELARMEGEFIGKKTKYDELNAYIGDLKELEKKGYAYPVEISHSQKKMRRLQKEVDIARQKHQTYKNFFLPTAVQTARAKVQRAQMVVRQTRKGVGFKIGKAAADLKKARNELKKYTRELKNAGTQLQKTVIRSPQDGLAVMKENFRKGEYRKPRVGDTVFPNQAILFLPDISSMMAKVLIREVDLDKLGTGKKVNLRADAYPHITLTGHVAFIGALAERRREIRAGGEKYFKVHVLVREKEERLRPGMTVRVEILVTGGPKQALTVPIHAVHERKGRQYVYVAGPRGFRERPVVVGMQNLEHAEILDGLRRGDRVCLAAPPSEGMVTR